MKQSSMFLVAALVLMNCNNGTPANRASVLGPVDLVIVDKLDGDSLAVLPGYAADGTVIERVGYHGGRVFVTSTDSNELRVFEPFREGTVNNADWARAPNPLETLSIPVLDQPQILVADEGVTADGRVTGAYVYAARRSGAELSIISARSLKQVGGHPVPLPAPLMAVGAWMNVTGPALPATTSVYVATWDGTTSRVVTASIPIDEEQLAATLGAGTLAFTDVTVVPNEPIKALQVVPPRVGRTLDGAPFCDTAICLAIATRKVDGTGRSVLLDPATGVSATLSFGAQMRDFAVSFRPDGDLRLYGIIDEEPCGGAFCGGVLSVELSAGTSAMGFPLTTDVTGAPMQPMRAGDGLVLGLTIGPGARLNGSVETITDGGYDAAQSQIGYSELGAFSTSNGAVTFFNAQYGMIIDFNARRVAVDYAQVRRPEILEDGGAIFARPDGGPTGTLEALPVDVKDPVVGSITTPWREVSVGAADGGVWKLTLGDGYLSSQVLYAISNGNLPGLTNLADTGGTQLRVPAGAEAVAAVGDIVRFFDGVDDQTLAECGRASVTAIQSGAITFDPAPTDCKRNEAARVTIKAAGTKFIVLLADTEGYLGRVEAGETFVYRRRYAALPLNVGRSADPENGIYAPSDALRIEVPAEPLREEGAYIAFGITGYLAPFRAQIDAVNTFSNAGQSYCYLSNQTASQVVIGNIAMSIGPRPVGTSTAPEFTWWTYGVVPSGNALSVMINTALITGANNSLSGAVTCRQ